MIGDEEAWRAEFESMGETEVRAQLAGWRGTRHATAYRWLAEKDEEAHRLSESSKFEQIEIARLAKDAALASNILAREENSLAREANSIARAAAAAADRSAREAEKSNTIATVALIAAVIAIAISIIGIFIRH